MNTTQSRSLTTLATLITLATPALADVYIEIGYANQGPDAITNGDLPLNSPTPMSVWIWADQSNLTIDALEMDLNGQSRFGIPNTGGTLLLDTTGTPDPDNHFAFPATPGTLSPDHTTISDITYLNFTFPADPLPTSMETAWVIYTDLTGTAIDAGSGIMPIINLLTFQSGTPSQTIHTYGLYETPTPSTTLLLGCAGLLTTRRRR